MTTDTRSRAAKLLGLPEGATGGEATTAFLTALPSADFLPAGWAVASLNALAGTAIPTEPDEDAAAGLRADVEEFARGFWSLAPADRCSAWAALNNSRPDPRLLALRPGLDVDADAPGEVAALARELFVLPPRDRAVRRNEWLLANAARHPELTRAAAELRRPPGRRRPRPDPLRPPLPAVRRRRLRRRGHGRPGRACRPAAGSPGGSAAVRTTATASPTRTGKVRWDSSTIGGYFLLVIVVVALRAGFGGSSRNSVPTYTMPYFNPQNFPSLTMPTFPKSSTIPTWEITPPPERIILSSFTPGQVEEFKAWEKQKEKDRVGQYPPFFYADWVRAGKPEADRLPNTPTFPRFPSTRR